MTETITHELLENLTRGIEDEIREVQAFKSSYTLGKGVRTASASNRPLYSFDLVNPPLLQGETPGRLSVGGTEVECTVISRRSDGLDVATFVDFGDEIDSAVLTVDRSELLSILSNRLEGFRDSHGLAAYNRALAAKVLDLSRNSPPDDSAFIAAPDDLTDDQKEAFRRALRNEVTFIWGPPGTGKTVTLSAIVGDLFRQNKRVLVVSHTNRAVDGIALALCKRIVGRARSSLPEGAIVRLGAIGARELREQFAGQISLESLAELHSRKIRERIALVRKERELNAQEFEHERSRLELSSKLQALQDELSVLQKMYDDARSSESSLQTVLRVLRIRQGAATESGYSIDEVKRSIRNITGEILETASSLEGVSSDEVRERCADLEARDEELTEAIRDLEALGEDAARSAIDRSRVVACTTAHALLRSESLGEFDVVVIDEGSMVPLPLVVFLSGLARERVVIGGDFRQLPAISHSKSEASRTWFARDIFEVSGVVDRVEEREEHPSVAILTTQFRGHEGLSALINERFYGGRLTNTCKEEAANTATQLPDWLSRGSLILVDSSSLRPVGHTENKSKGNLIHAILAREICYELERCGLAKSSADVGVVAPYRSQVTLIEDLLDESLLPVISVGTAHRFQGAERETMVVDLTESSPHVLGSFLGATSLRETGAKLLNVSLTRAQSRLIVIADLGYLRGVLSDAHILHGILEDIKLRGVVVDAHDVVESAVSPFLVAENASAGSSRSQRFDHESFLPGVLADCKEAKQVIRISSKEVGFRTAHIFGAVLRPLVDSGIQVEVAVEAHGTSGVHGDQGDDAVEAMIASGVSVSYVERIVCEGISVDDEVVWIGTVSPLKCVDLQSASVLRVVSAVAGDLFAHGQAALVKVDPHLLLVGNT